MGIPVVDVAAKLTSDEMQLLVEKVFAKFNQEFEVLTISKVGKGKMVHIRLKSGVAESVVVGG